MEASDEREEVGEEGSHPSHGMQSWAVIPALGTPIRLLSFAAPRQPQPSRSSLLAPQERTESTLPAGRVPQSPAVPPAAAIARPGHAARVRRGGKTPTPLTESLQCCKPLSRVWCGVKEKAPSH